MEVNATKQRTATELSFGGSYSLSTESDGDDYSDYDEREWGFCDANPQTYVGTSLPNAWDSNASEMDLPTGCGAMGFPMLGASLLGMIAMRSSRRLRC
ncbi:MAG: hypothetical protein HRF50_05525 [Phycisphaerae bacterium]